MGRSVRARDRLLERLSLSQQFGFLLANSLAFKATDGLTKLHKKFSRRIGAVCGNEVWTAPNPSEASTEGVHTPAPRPPFFRGGEIVVTLPLTSLHRDVLQTGTLGSAPRQVVRSQE